MGVSEDWGIASIASLIAISGSPLSTRRALMKRKSAIYLVIGVALLLALPIVRQVALEHAIAKCDAEPTSLMACTDLIWRDPTDKIAYHNRGGAFLDVNDADRAIADFTKAIDLDSAYGSAYNNRGYAHLKKGEYDKAIADFTKAIEINPQHGLALNNRAWAHLQIGMTAQALQDIEKSLLLQPDDGRAWNTRGHILEALGRRDQAISDFRQSLARNPNNQSSREALERLGIKP